MKLRTMMVSSISALVLATAVSACASSTDAPESAASTAAAAQGDRAPGGMRMFEHADTNSDGTITLEEVRAAAAARFNEADVNRDGFVEGDELQKLGPPGGSRGGRMGGRMGGMMKMADADGDGKISAAEHANHAQQRFTRLDANSDGAVTQQEAEAHRGHGQGRGHGPGKGGGPGGKGGHFKAFADQLFTEADVNADGSVTRAELDALRNKHFAAADANKDGFLDAAEMASWQGEQMSSRRGEHFARMDSNKDGALTIDEVPPGMRGRFATADANGDGRLTQQEMTAAGPMGRGKGQGPHGGRFMGRLDTDGDGKVSAAEFAQKPGQWFTTADADGNGAVTRAELDAMRRPGPR